MKHVNVDSKADFDIESLVRRGVDARFTREYNCDLRRLFPWKGTVQTKRPITEFGTIWVRVRAGEAVDRHDHDEEEAFIVLSGEAELQLEAQTTLLTKGDVAYVPRFWTHQITNKSNEAFEFLDVYWDFGIGDVGEQP